MKRRNEFLKKTLSLTLTLIIMGSAVAGPFELDGVAYAKEVEDEVITDTSSQEVVDDFESITDASLEQTVIEMDDAEATESFVEQSIDLFGQEAVEDVIGSEVVLDSESEEVESEASEESDVPVEGEDIESEGAETSEETIAEEGEVVVNNYGSAVEASEITEVQVEAIVENFYSSGRSSDGTYGKYSSDYLYNNLTSAQRNYYDALYSASLSYLTSTTSVSQASSGYYIIQCGFSTYGLSQSTAIQIAQIFLYTNPQFFFYESGYSKSSSYIGLIVNSNFANGTTRASARDSIFSKIQTVMNSIGSISNAEGVRAVHDWLYNNVSYQSGSYDQGVYSTFVQGISVCAGYSEGFSMLVNALGSGSGIIAINVTSLTGSSGHEWNQVYVGGKWYIVDVTWDDTGSGQYTFFLKSEEYVFGYSTYSKNMHTLESFWYLASVPDCTPTYGTNSMYRLYNPNSGEHFYTNSSSERQNLVNVGWNYEGVAWYAPTSGSEVYRLYNPNAGDHHYTTSASERNYLVSVGWNYEGVGWYSGGSVPLYRAYNPNASSGSHHYTTSYTEISYIVSLGWRYEGIGWYGC